MGYRRRHRSLFYLPVLHGIVISRKYYLPYMKDTKQSRFSRRTKTALLIVALAFLLTGGAIAVGLTPKTAQADCKNGSYAGPNGKTVCRAVYSVGVPSGAVARCKDGTYSFNANKADTCSHHAGVENWLR